MKKGLSQDKIQPFIIEKSLFPNLFAQTPSSRYATLREPSFPYGDGFAARIRFVDFSLMGYFLSSPSCDAL